MMKRLTPLLLIAFLSFIVFSCREHADQDLKLWYDKPATIWEEALPIGNGRLGAMIYGGTGKDHIQFNEETLWTGEPHDYSNEGASGYLEKIRELIWQGKQKEAEALAMEKFMSVPLRQKAYQPFGDVWLTFPGHEKAAGYYRELDISKAICITTYKVGETTFKREYFASYPDNIIAVNLSADKKRSLTFDVELTAEHEGYVVKAEVNGVIQLDVKVKEGILTGSSILKVITKGGDLSVNSNTLQIKEADQAEIYLVAATSFINPSDVSGNPVERCDNYISEISDKPYRNIKKAHIEDYQNFFDRFSIKLGPSEYENLPTDIRISKVLTTMDNSLAALYVQYGRYLMLSDSRPGTYPANLQGIWNDKLNPPWDSKYTVNINTEMNYWPVEVLNISECHEALFKMLAEVIPSGEKVAKVHYNAGGWVLHHNTDLWRGAAPINASNHGIWVTGSGWLAHHYWEHFLYNRDTVFLSKVAWPVLKGAAQFYTDFLVPDPKTGWLVSCPSNSPENGGLVSGPTMDHQIIKSLFKICIESSEILNEDQEFADTLKMLLPKIAPYQIGRFGQLQEWMEDKDDPENKHRHVSHLWGVYPGKEINWQDTPELMEAAKQSLIFRGDEGAGWSLAWKISFWARFRDGNHAWQMVRTLLRPFGQFGPGEKTNESYRGGSYPNLLDACPPFQIDGNFGGAAGIVEMLIQSHLGSIDLLPALPDEIPEGHIRGICARGGFELDFTWSAGKLASVRVISRAGMPISIRYEDKIYLSETQKGEVIKLDGNLKKL
jgi:alpha-L-fucosidase 2